MITIAYIEDYVLFRECLATEICKYFEKIEVYQYSDGWDFVEKFSNQNYTPSVILMDVSLPNLNCYKTAELLQKICPDIPILILNVLTDEKALISLSKRGIKGIVSKKANLKTLISAIKILMQGDYFFEETSITKKILISTKKSLPNVGLDVLTAKEIQILQLICSDKTSKQIANEACISERTYAKHKQNIADKLNIRTREGLVIYAFKTGLVNLF